MQQVSSDIIKHIAKFLKHPLNLCSSSMAIYKILIPVVYICSNTYRLLTQIQKKFVRRLMYISNKKISLSTEFPPQMTHLTFGHNFNQMLEPGIIPYGVANLTFGDEYNQFLTQGLIPSSVRNLKLGYDFRLKLKPYDLPYRITHLTLEAYPLELNPGVLPSSLTHLSIPYYASVIYCGVLPPGLISLTFKRHFNYILSPGVLPLGLKYLDLGQDFNKKIPSGMIPAGILKIYVHSLVQQSFIPQAFQSRVILI